MAKPPTFPNLEGLADLASRDAVDIRPTLLRVLTDLYVQKPSHTADEERHYAELALRLIEAVGPAVRAAIAAKLATYRHAPRTVVERLARAGHDVTATTPKTGAGLTAIDFKAMIDRLAPSEHDEPVDERGIVQSAPETTQDPQTDTRPALESDDHGTDGETMSLEPPRDTPTAYELMELFFNADPVERELILMASEFVSVDIAAEPPRPTAVESLRRMEISALTHQRQIFLRELALALELSRPLVERIIDDKFGEPVLVAAKALGMRADMLQRILLFLNPTVGHSVRRVYELAKLYDQIAPQSAAVLLRIWRAADSHGDGPTATALPHRPLAQLRPEATQTARPQLQHVERRAYES